MPLATNRRFAAIAFQFLLCASLSAQPRTVLIIRHAEKPAGKVDPNLTPKGYERASALVNLFPASFERPDYLFATKASKHSNRPVETVTPLAKALHLPLSSNIDDASYPFLAREILTNHQYNGKVVMICWHHGTIPGLARALGVSNPPERWPDQVFDRVWRIRFAGTVATLDILPQHLLPGDPQE